MAEPVFTGGTVRKRRIWRALVASAVIGLVEAAGLDRRGRIRKRPLRVVWMDDREPADPLARTGVWFLEPVGDPRPEPADLRHPHGGSLRLARFVAPPLSVRRYGRS